MCTKKAGRIVLSGVIFAAISYVIHMLGALLDMGYYLDPNYFRVWSKIMMPTAGPPPMEFTLYSSLFSLIGGILFALVYYYVKDSIKLNGAVKKGLFYGLLVTLVAVIPGYLSLILLINLPLMLVVSWAVQGVIVNLLGGMITAKLIK
jgi:hypothetical protein